MDQFQTRITASVHMARSVIDKWLPAETEPATSSTQAKDEEIRPLRLGLGSQYLSHNQYIRNDSILRNSNIPSHSKSNAESKLQRHFKKGKKHQEIQEPSKSIQSVESEGKYSISSSKKPRSTDILDFYLNKKQKKLKS